MLEKIMEIAKGIAESADSLRGAFDDEEGDGSEDSSWYDSNQDGKWNDEAWYSEAWNAWWRHDGNDYLIVKSAFKDDQWPGKDDEDWQYSSAYGEDILYESKWDYYQGSPNSNW